jgi:lambda family phage portal protein
MASNGENGRGQLRLVRQTALVPMAAADMDGGSGWASGYAAGRRSTKRTSQWRAKPTGPSVDILTDLPTLRGRSRDLERNNALSLGAINTKAGGVIGAGLTLRAVLDADVLGIDPARIAGLQYQIEREWEIFEAEADYCGLMHLKDLERVMYRSARVSGDIGIGRRYRKRPGDTYGTRVVMIEADRISNPRNAADSDVLMGGVSLAQDGEVLGCYVTNRHPGELRGPALTWTFVPRRGPSGQVQMLIAGEMLRPGQVRGVPLFAPIMEDLKQLGDYREAELKAALNDAYLFAFEQQAADKDEDGNPIVTRSDGIADDAGELTLSDLQITTLAPGSSVNVKKPERPNSGFDGFVDAIAKQIGAALGIPFELLVQHFSASFSASRGALELAYKGFQIEQAWFVRSILDPIREWQFTEMVASGRFEAPGFFDDPVKRRAWLGCIWIGPTRVQINPQVEANADDIDLRNGVKSREQVMTERTGGDFDTKSKQWVRENDVVGKPGAAQTASAQPAEKNNDGTDKGSNE